MVTCQGRFGVNKVIWQCASYKKKWYEELCSLGSCIFCGSVMVVINSREYEAFAAQEVDGSPEIWHKLVSCNQWDHKSGVIFSYMIWSDVRWGSASLISDMLIPVIVLFDCIVILTWSLTSADLSTAPPGPDEPTWRCENGECQFTTATDLLLVPPK